MQPRELDRSDYERVAEAIGDAPFTTLPAHALRRGRCQAFIAGALPEFAALIIQRDAASDEPVAFGGDARVIAGTLALVEGWTCIEVEPAVAPELAAILARDLGRPTRLYEDLHFILDGPPSPASDRAVRLLTPGDESLLGAAHPSLRPADHDEIRWLLREGACACAIVDGQVVARADCSAWTARYADIGVATLEAFRSRGYATAAAALVIAETRRRGLTPIWSTGEDNWASQRVARKLGFREVGRLTYVIPTSPAS